MVSRPCELTGLPQDGNSTGLHMGRAARGLFHTSELGFSSDFRRFSRVAGFSDCASELGRSKYRMDVIVLILKALNPFWGYKGIQLRPSSEA